MKVILAFTEYFTVPIGGIEKRTKGGVLSSGPPLGGICRAHDRKRIKRNIVFLTIEHFLNDWASQNTCFTAGIQKISFFCGLLKFYSA
jgi:hypothetical protein